MMRIIPWFRFRALLFSHCQPPSAASVGGSILLGADPFLAVNDEQRLISPVFDRKLRHAASLDVSSAAATGTASGRRSFKTSVMRAARSFAFNEQRAFQRHGACFGFRPGSGTGRGWSGAGGRRPAVPAPARGRSSRRSPNPSRPAGRRGRKPAPSALPCSWRPRRCGP